MTNLTLAAASIIVDEAIAEARRQKLSPLTVVVLDAGGHVVALKREDGSSLLRPEIATGKAWGCLGMGTGGRNIVKRSVAAPAFFNALIEMSAGRMVPSPGGVLVRDAGGAIIGAVGISGDAGENDEACAVAGIKAAGLTADTGAA